jgi:hypothetical protein
MCLAFGGQVEVLSSAFFRCSAHSPWIALGGPLGNLVVGMVAFLAQGSMSPTRSVLRFYASCVMAFSLYWEAGYIVAAMARNDGDVVFAWQGFFGRPNWIVRGCGVTVGALSYLLITRLTARRLQVFAETRTRIPHLLRPAWMTGVLVMAGAAGLYAPNRVGAVRDAALSVMAAFPMLSAFASVPLSSAPAPRISRNRWIVAIGGTVVLVFALTMGRGLY